MIDFSSVKYFKKASNGKGNRIYIVFGRYGGNLHDDKDLKRFWLIRGRIVWGECIGLLFAKPAVSIKLVH